MPIRGVDHIYAEALHGDESAAFTEGWGSARHRAGRVVTADAAVAVAEVTRGKPESSVCALEAADASRWDQG